MRILVTGSHTIQQLLACGHDVIVFDSLESRRRPAISGPVATAPGISTGHSRRYNWATRYFPKRFNV
jgi:nucleoside-diphosphate-sugar epimerase